MTKTRDPPLSTSDHLLADDAPILLTAEQRAAIALSKAAAARGDFATDEEIRAVWAKHGL